MRYHYNMECPKCGKKRKVKFSEKVGTKLKEVNCPDREKCDGIMKQLEVVEI